VGNGETGNGEVGNSKMGRHADVIPNEAATSCCPQLRHLTILSQDAPSASASVQ